jgi:proline iminopeptidase
LEVEEDMKTSLKSPGAAALLLLLLWAEVHAGPRDLWPEIEPFEEDYLAVGALHEIYYEVSGNPDGKPVFVLHGGPGGRSSPETRRFFDPERFMIVLHDQRGCGKSKPYGEIRENTTWHLVEDIEQLRTHLGSGEILLFGGSWGSTLALAYAETYPANVSGMVLRGIFTGTDAEVDHLYHGGVAKLFPETYEKLIYSLPSSDRRPLPEYLYNLIADADSAGKMKYSKAWAAYELKVSSLSFPDGRLEKVLREFDSYTLALFENYYMSNRCFLEEGQLLRDTEKIRHIPAVLVNGRYDVVCPPINAYRLHRLLPNSRLVIAEGAGHWMGEKPVKEALIEAMGQFE